MSASVSLITQSLEQHVMLEVEKVPFPIEPSWPRSKKRRLAALMTSLVWRFMREDDEAVEEMGDANGGIFWGLLRARYRVWLSTPEGQNYPEKSSKKPRNNNHLDCHFGEDEGNLQGVVEEMAQRVAGLFNQVRNIGTRRLLFWNYVEAGGSLVSEGKPSEIPVWIRDSSWSCPS